MQPPHLGTRHGRRLEGALLPGRRVPVIHNPAIAAAGARRAVRVHLARPAGVDCDVACCRGRDVGVCRLVFETNGLKATVVLSTIFQPVETRALSTHGWGGASKLTCVRPAPPPRRGRRSLPPGREVSAIVPSQKEQGERHEASNENVSELRPTSSAAEDGRAPRTTDNPRQRPVL